VEEGKPYFGEVRFYALATFGTVKKPLAFVSVYSQPDPDLLAASSGTYWSVEHSGNSNVQVVSVKGIQAVVAAVPDLQFKKRFGLDKDSNRWYIAERPGLKITSRIGEVEGELYVD
jgi:hypothetical protein